MIYIISVAEIKLTGNNRYSGTKVKVNPGTMSSAQNVAVILILFTKFSFDIYP